MTKDEMEMLSRKLREDNAKETARRTNKSVTYKDTDGCEVTVTELGYVFYNAADWW